MRCVNIVVFNPVPGGKNITFIEMHLVYRRSGMDSKGEKDLWSGDDEALYAEMVWTFVKNGCE